MCDTFVALPPASARGVVFGKNSDRERNEAQALELHPAGTHAEGAAVRVTRTVIPQLRRTRAVLLSRPYWMWGAEMGANDAGVVIGNEAVHSMRPPERAPALLGMDLVRLGLERGDTAADACAVIVGLLEAHGQGGNCGHLHPHFYHNSFIVADAGSAFVLETVGREHAIERVAGLRSISNAYVLPEMRVHADVAREAAGDGPARCARTAELLGRHAGAIGPAAAMAALRDHGPEAEQEAGPGGGQHGQAEGPLDGRAGGRPGAAADGRPDWRPHGRQSGAIGWHPQDTRGRTVCMHAGAGERRGQSVGSMVSELQGGAAVHWVTGTAAPCTSIFKPVTFEAGLPGCGPLPGGRADGSLWWRHERLHRALVRRAGFLPEWLVAEREAIEAGFVARAREGASAEVVRACWAEAEAAEARWAARLAQEGVPGRGSARGDFVASWDSLSLLAGA